MYCWLLRATQTFPDSVINGKRAFDSMPCPCNRSALRWWRVDVCCSSFSVLKEVRLHATISKGNWTLWMNDGGNKGRTKAAAGGVAWLIVEELTLFCNNTTIRMLSLSLLFALILGLANPCSLFFDKALFH